MQDTKKIVHVRTNITRGCPECGGASIGGDDFEKSVNHLIQDHGYKLLHVGSERDDDQEGKSIHHTVAVLGK
jgi:hypothetical protein